MPQRVLSYLRKDRLQGTTDNNPPTRLPPKSQTESITLLGGGLWAEKKQEAGLLKKWDGRNGTKKTAVENV